jgi:two-component system chemotaxis response regulator CheY
MEPMSGYELLVQVRANAETANTPFILVTAESKPDNVVAAKKAGVNDYLIKPFNEKVLKEKIDRALAGGTME